MLSNWRIHGVGLTALVGSVVLLSGCTGKGKNGAGGSDGAEADHLQAAYQLVREYTTAKKHNPTSLEDVKKWATAEHKKGVDADTFVSTRDHEEYVLENMPMGAALHEKTGADGNVYNVMPGGGQVQRVPAAQLNNMLESVKRAGDQYKGKK